MTKLDLRWLAPRKAPQASVNFGTPWGKGDLMPGEEVALQDDNGNQVPMQTKINAYWPDGSVKWLLHSGVLDTRKSYSIGKGSGVKTESPIAVNQNEDGSITIESHLLSLMVMKGETFIPSLIRKRTAQKPMSAQLYAFIENREELDGVETVKTHKMIGMAEKITLEENGPIRAVVKIEGSHKHTNRLRTMFPFVIRLYVYADSDEIRIVHSFVFDADENVDFLKGLAVQFRMQASGELWNRHVGFAGDTGMFYESVQPMYTYRGIHPLYEKQQIEAQFVTIDPKSDAALIEQVRDNASWSNFRLQQHACDHYAITKSTRHGCAFIPAAQGNRSMGAAFFGDESAIIAAAVKDFWQKCPMALEISNAAEDTPVMTVWLWSKYAEAYDFRAYDTVQHEFSYGDINNHPEGIANTNEILIKLFDRMPGKRLILDFAEDVQTDSLLIADLAAYEETTVFGTYWCQPKDEKYQNAAHERALLEFLDYYMKETEQRKWYGFWDYGDVMHTYDPIRHSWRYDVGGFAWQNTELCNTYVNWLAFLRTGDYSIYRFARAMTRHTSEVDIYHSGVYAGLGSRHNVRHWGCRWKEVRISMAGHHRFFYYLTGDDRIGDIMDSVKDADFVAREDQKPEDGVMKNARTGPDWSSFVSNWMTRWERYQDTRYRDKILAGISSIKMAPNRLSSGSTFRYDPSTGYMHYIGEGNYQYHMVICFGAPETWFELAELIEDEEFKEMLAQFGDYYAMSPDERKEKSQGLFNESNDKAWEGIRFAIRMVAYAGYRFKKPERMRQAIAMLEAQADLSSNTPGRFDEQGHLIYNDIPVTESVRPISEVEFANTNGISQWSLNYIETAKLRELMDFSE
ncbi:hypothetical protein [Paenibacillus sp. LHD-38]|uniref:exo-rhamnogalacturonan lyase family protein n=1 Tax=Paenibacillus sp. LHD-38 TaxID=3072143 RepID=UPI00280C5445|nr:hypothetical protein [Paenibacillus sp. LHD-38]MDQ8734753.1 hypothetical protein [Paenibacillus sp. LHD-38]